MVNDNDPLLQRIVRDPAILAGKPTIRGTRVPVSLIFNLLAHGYTFERIAEDYPYVAPDDIKAALTYAELRIDDREPQDVAVH